MQLVAESGVVGVVGVSRCQGVDAGVWHHGVVSAIRL